MPSLLAAMEDCGADAVWGPLELFPLRAREREAVAVLVGAVEAGRHGDAEESIALPCLAVLEDRCRLNVRGVACASRLRGAEPRHPHPPPAPAEPALAVGLRWEPAEDVADEHVLALGAADVLRRHLERGSGESDAARLDRQDRLRRDGPGVRPRP